MRDFFEVKVENSEKFAVEFYFVIQGFEENVLVLKIHRSKTSSVKNKINRSKTSRVFDNRNYKIIK